MTDPRLFKFVEPAIISHAKWYPRGPFISITLAQLADESAFGTKTSGLNNFFGIKANHAQIAAGQATKLITREWIEGKYVFEPLYFANYGSPEICFDAHASLLCEPWYQRCVDATTPQEYAEALHACGYATEPEYRQILIRIMEENNLYAYDRNP